MKIVDKDGSYKYSKVVITTRAGGDNVQVLVYPNPVLRNTTLQIKKANDNRSLIEVFNSMGQRVYANQMSANLYNVTIDIPGKWSAGVYMIRVFDSKERWSRVVMVKYPYEANLPGSSELTSKTQWRALTGHLYGKGGLSEPALLNLTGK